MNAAAAAMIAIKMQLALIPLDTMIASVNRVSLETGEIVQVKLQFLFHLSNENRRGPPPPTLPTSFILSRKLGDKNEYNYIFPSAETRLVTLRWEGRRDTLYSSLFFGKSGGGANASSQDPRL